MKLSEIPTVRAGSSIRKSISSLDESSQERMVLGTRAADLLGYRGLVANVTGEMAISVQPGPLADVLNSSGVEVLDLFSVLEYQMQEMVRVTREKIEDGNLNAWAIGYWREAGWEKTVISSYRQPIPEFVIDLAIRIKEKVPGVVFHVQHLQNPKADPFLVASVDNEIYYVAAWDEPRFEGRTTL